MATVLHRSFRWRVYFLRKLLSGATARGISASRSLAITASMRRGARPVKGQYSSGVHQHWLTGRSSPTLHKTLSAFGAMCMPAPQLLVIKNAISALSKSRNIARDLAC